MYQCIVVGDQQDFVVGVYQYCGDQFVVVFGGLDVDYILCVMVFVWVVWQWSLFVVVVFGGGQDVLYVVVIGIVNYCIVCGGGFFDIVVVFVFVFDVIGIFGYDQVDYFFVGWYFDVMYVSCGMVY